MILVVDKTMSDRAAELREKLFHLSCPCAVCALSEIKENLPAKVIITYSGMLSEVRQRLSDNVFVLVIGKEFINSALNAACCPDETAAVNDALSIHTNTFYASGKPATEFGVMLSPAVFLAYDFIEIYGNMIPLSPTESLVMKYLAAMSDEKHPIPASVIAAYCLSRASEVSSNSVAVHISGINSKARAYYGNSIIRSVSGCGYYSDANLNKA